MSSLLMKTKHYILNVSILLLLTSCGGSENAAISDTGSENAAISDTRTGDRIAFREIGSGDAFQIDLTVDRLIENFNDPESLGDYITPLTYEVSSEKKWENKKSYLNTICSLEMRPEPTSIENGIPQYDRQVSVISPDGEYLGFVEDLWEPVWSPDGSKVAFACGQDDQGNIFVVDSSDHSTSNPSEIINEQEIDCGKNCTYNPKDWSRDNSAKLSDRMEIFVSTLDGSNTTQMTNNERGDWLPQWFPTTSFSEEGKLFETIAAKRPIIIETNRTSNQSGIDDKSDVYILSTVSTESWSLSVDYYKAQAPAWSEKGSFAVFKGGGIDESQLVVTFNLAPRLSLKIDLDGVPISWNR